MGNAADRTTRPSGGYGAGDGPGQYVVGDPWVLPAYFLLVFGVAWAVWLPIVAAERGLVHVRVSADLVWLAGIAPVGSATLVTFLERRWRGVRDLFGRFLVRGVRPRWYVIALLLPLTFRVAAAGLDTLAGGHGGAAGVTCRAIAEFLGRAILFAPVAAFEEVGWRGFALPRLQARWSAVAAAVILGALWAVWHLPLWWLRSFGYQGMSFGWWFAEVIGASILITWLFNSGGRSLWIPCLFHSASNAAWAAMPMSSIQALVRAVVVATALAVVAVCGPMRLGPVASSSRQLKRELRAGSG